MDIEKIRAVGQEILREPRRFNMGTWGDFYNASDLPHVASPPPCGTICCFAGVWSIIFEEYTPREVAIGVNFLLDNPVEFRCLKGLNLPNVDLLHSIAWPITLQEGIVALTPGSEEYASYFVNVVLEDYIATDGWADVP